MFSVKIKKARERRFSSHLVIGMVPAACKDTKLVKVLLLCIGGNLTLFLLQKSSNVGDIGFPDSRTSIVLGIVFKFTGATTGPEQSKVPQKMCAKEERNFLIYVKRCAWKFLVQVQKYGCLRLSVQMPKYL